MGATNTKTYGGGATLFVTAGVRRGHRRVVAPRRGGGSQVRRGAGAADAGKLMVRNPAKYLHLVTGGRKEVLAKNAKVLFSHHSDTFFGRRAKKVGGRDFVREAFDATASKVVSLLTTNAPDLVAAQAAQLVPQT
jgi:hypothetical protein